ncbi:MAG: NUDIX domain-containing protein [Devosiaceae bacterium]|nr:NUDIX domain-containing protein [Devosiaceae bacterium MH13]
MASNHRARRPALRPAQGVCQWWRRREKGEPLDGRLKRLRRALWFRAFAVVRGVTLGVRVIATDEAGQVVLVRHGYTAGWYLPGGGVDLGESAETAARRELVEETGLKAVGPLTCLGLFHNARQWKGDHVVLFRADRVERVAPFKASYEIAACDAFALDALPEDTTPGTRARLEEWQTGRQGPATWT